MPHNAIRATVTSRMLVGIEAFAVEKGFDYGELARLIGLDRRAASDPDATVPLESVLALFETIARETGDDVFGARFAERMPVGRIGLYHFVTVNAPTLRSALENRVRFVGLETNGYRVSLNADGAGARYVWHGPVGFGPSRHFEGYAVALLIESIRYMLQDRAWRPDEVALRQPAPSGIDVLHRVMTRNIVFNAPRASMLLDAASLARPLPGADRLLQRELVAAADSALSATVEAGSLLDDLRRLILRSMGRPGFGIQAAASDLAVSVRSLQRELTANNTTFSVLLDEVRRSHAVQILSDTNLPLTEVAFMLGFSDLSAFSRAATRWFGKPPSRMRTELRTPRVPTPGTDLTRRGRSVRAGPAGVTHASSRIGTPWR